MSAENASNQPTTEVFEIDGIKPDFTFSVGTVPKKVTFVGHRTVLAMVSRVFSQMFKGSRDDGDQVDLTTDSPDVFRMFLDWTYRTKGFEASALDVYKVDSLLALADKYDCPALISDLCNVLNQRIRKSDAAINLEPYYIAVKHSLPIVSQFDQVVALTKQSIYEKAIAIIAVYDPKLPSDSKD